MMRRGPRRPAARPRRPAAKRPTKTSKAPPRSVLAKVQGPNRTRPSVQKAAGALGKAATSQRKAPRPAGISAAKALRTVSRSPASRTRRSRRSRI